MQRGPGCCTVQNRISFNDPFPHRRRALLILFSTKDDEHRAITFVILFTTYVVHGGMGQTFALEMLEKNHIGAIELPIK